MGKSAIILLATDGIGIAYIGVGALTGGQFTVKSAYSMLNDGDIRDARTSKIWNLQVPLKVKVFCLIVFKKRALIADNLLKRGWIGNTACVLCGVEEETVDHLFTRCVFSRFLLVATLEYAQSRDWGDDVSSVWDRWMTRIGMQSLNTTVSGLVACWWIIWEVRNGVIFRKTQPEPFFAAYKIKQLTNLWEQFLPGNRRHACSR
uniref:Reverse transcriptase zinc-binding domain-containing protein n=1 Tax=Ananas comosus var. bracteatus TaxID=296719 RepID=A0A6V7NJT0_ANACO|nr:unnamed protein product [Ananas comosus var. bracteatus]